MNPDNLIKVNHLRRKELDNELSRIYVWRSLKEAKSSEAKSLHNKRQFLNVFYVVIGMAREVVRLNLIAHDRYDKKLNVI